MSALTQEDRDNLVAYLDGELDTASARRLEAKLSLDPAARAEADALKQAWGLLDYLPKAEPSTHFTARTLERLTIETGALTMQAPTTSRWSGPWRRMRVILAMLLGAGILGLILGVMVGRPAPRDDGPADEGLIRHLHAVENWRYYQHVDDLDFVRQLARPELFGEEPGS